MSSNNPRVTNTGVVSLLAIDAFICCDEDSIPSSSSDSQLKRQKLCVNTVSVLWQQDRLPATAVSIIALPAEMKLTSSNGISNEMSPLSGSLVVISMNAILLVSEDSVVGVACNGFASTTVSSHIPLQSYFDALTGGSKSDEGDQFILFYLA